MVKGKKLTAYLHLVPQLRLALPRRLALGPNPSLHPSLTLHHTALLQPHLARMHKPPLRVLGTRPLLAALSHTRRRTTRNLARPHAAHQPPRLLPLQLLEHLLHRHRIDDLLCGRGKDSQHRERAVLLVLLEAPPQVLFRDAVFAHAYARFAELGKRVLAC